MPNDDDAPSWEGGGSEPVGDRVRIFRRGRTWYANFQHGGRQHRPSLRTDKKKEALRRALRIEAELATGRWAPAPESATVAQAIAAYRDYLRAEERAPKTLSKYEKGQADCTSRWRWVGARRAGYHRRDGAARAGRVVPAAPRGSHRRSRMPAPTRHPAPPRA